MTTAGLVRYSGSISMLNLTDSNVRAWIEVFPGLRDHLRRRLFIPVNAKCTGLTLDSDLSAATVSGVRLVSVLMVKEAEFRLGDAYVQLVLTAGEGLMGMYDTVVIAPPGYVYRLIGAYFCPENRQQCPASDEDVALHAAFTTD